MKTRMLGWSGWALLLVAGACGGGDDDGGDDGTSADSGSGGAADASGGADGGRPDASAFDGGDLDGALADASTADAGGPDASTGPGVVSFTVDLGPILNPQGQQVFFLRADDSVVDIVLTDENGRAEAIFDEPGTVVAVLQFDFPGSSPNISAHLGVPPGTDIRRGAEISDRAAILDATGPAVEDPSGYGLETRCGRVFAYSPDPFARVNLAFCPPIIDVVWTAGGTVDGQEGIFSAYQPSVPVDAGSITVTGPLRRDVIQSTRVGGIPEVILSTRMLYRVFGAHGMVGRDQDLQDDLAVNEGAAVMVHPMHDLTGLGLRGWAYAYWTNPLTGTQMEMAATVLHDGSPNVNVAAVVPSILRDPVFDRATGIWTWTEEGPNAPTAIQGSISLNDPDLPRSWRIIAPRQGTSFRVPRLPPPYDNLNIAADTPIYSAQLNQVSHSRGYAPILADIDAMLFAPGEVGDIIAIDSYYSSVVQ